MAEYGIPEECSWTAHVQYIQRMPLTAPPQLHGFTSNADLAKDIRNIEQVMPSALKTVS